eukprot:TCONS_00025052-protein
MMQKEFRNNDSHMCHSGDNYNDLRIKDLLEHGHGIENELTRELNDTSQSGVPFYEYLVDEFFDCKALPSRDTSEFKRRHFGGGSPSDEVFKKLIAEAPDATIQELRQKLEKIGRNDILVDTKTVKCVFVKDLPRSVLSVITKRLDNSCNGVNSGWEEIAEEYGYNYSQRRAFKSARSKPNEWNPTKAILMSVAQYKPDFMLKDLVVIFKKIGRTDLAITLEKFITDCKSPAQYNKRQSTQHSQSLQSSQESVDQRPFPLGFPDIVNSQSKGNNICFNGAVANVYNKDDDDDQEKEDDVVQELGGDGSNLDDDDAEQEQVPMLQDDLGSELSQYKEEVRPPVIQRRQKQKKDEQPCQPIQAEEAPTAVPEVMGAVAKQEEAGQGKFPCNGDNDLYQHPVVWVIVGMVILLVTQNITQFIRYFF